MERDRLPWSFPRNGHTVVLSSCLPRFHLKISVSFGISFVTSFHSARFSCTSGSLLFRSVNYLLLQRVPQFLACDPSQPGFTDIQIQACYEFAKGNIWLGLDCFVHTFQIFLCQFRFTSASGSLYHFFQMFQCISFSPIALVVHPVSF